MAAYCSGAHSRAPRNLVNGERKSVSCKQLRRDLQHPLPVPARISSQLQDLFPLLTNGMGVPYNVVNGTQIPIIAVKREASKMFNQGAQTASVLVTGCSSRVGRATALALARAGLPTWASARRIEALSDLEAAGCHIVALDVTDEQSRINAVKTMEKA